jgi:hypothetical protein
VLVREMSFKAPGRAAGWLMGSLPRLARVPQVGTAIACWGAALWAVALLVRAHLVFMRPSVNLHVDEAYVAALAHRMIDGGMLPYVDGVSHRGPLLYWVASAFVLAAGKGWAAMRAAALTVAIACAAFTFLAGRRAGAPVAGAVGAWATPVVTLMVMHPGDGIAFSGEVLVNAFAMSGLFALAMGLVRPGAGSSRPWVAAAGALFMMAVLSKQSAALTLLAPALWVVVAARARPASGGWRLVAAFAAGALTPAVLVVLRYAASGKLSTFWYYYVRYNVAVYMAPYAKVDRLEELRAWASGHVLVVGAATLAVSWGLAQAVAAVRAERSVWRGLDRAGFLLVVAVGAACSVLAAKAPLRDWEHYFVQTIPWFGLLLGLVLCPPGRSRDPGPLFACLLVLPLASLVESGWALRAPDHRAHTLAARPPAECDLVQRYSRPGDRILVWGFWPQFYLDCHREPASRFVYTTIPAGVVPWFIDVPKSRDDELAAPGSREDLIGDLEKSQAALVLDNWFVDRPIRRYEALARYLDQHYYFVGATGGTRFYKRGKRNSRTLFDFEGRTLEGWTIEGDAFADSPKGGLGGQGPLTGQSGQALINTFTGARSDAATGTAVSPAFALDRDRFGLLVGGGVGCRIQLRIEGGPVLEQMQGPTAAEHLFEVNWDVRAQRGHSAQLAIIDEGTAPWAHCLVDRVELFDAD